ncbi:MAG: hypothetical protein A2177_05170 [Spirochaetes bacterium RBG_13_68_11]|nr:MAG: hypothetical protein A2177_05170 [Spirochaetes bacterium RBG_13_68_11]
MMKKVLRAFGIAAVGAIVVILWACAGTPETISHEEAWSRFVGQWTNPEAIGGRDFPEEHVYEADLTAKILPFRAYPERILVLKVKPRKSWVDTEGYIYCQVHLQYLEGWQMQMSEVAALMRVDKLGRTLEMNWIQGIPEEGATTKRAYKNLERIDPELGKKLGSLTTYWIYYRK